MEIKKSSIVLLVLLLLAACQNNSKTEYTDEQIRELKLIGGKTIAVKETHPVGASLSTVVITREKFDDTEPISLINIDPISKIETADLDGNGTGELYIFTKAVGSGSYGEIIAYTLNKDESLVKIQMPELTKEDTNNGGVFEGYMGHDSFTVERKRIIRKFPKYKKNDSNSQPTGGDQVVVYTLKNNKLEISKYELIIVEKREIKFDQIIKCLKNRDTAQLRVNLSDYRPVSNEEIKKIISDIYQDWGNLSNSSLVDKEKRFNKGDLIFKSHLQFTNTHYGNWSTFKNKNIDSYLRIGVLFKKNTDKVGGFVIAEIPR